MVHKSRNLVPYLFQANLNKFIDIFVFIHAEKFRSDLMRIAMTTLSSKILSQDKENFANLAVDAVMRLKVSF